VNGDNEWEDAGAMGVREFIESRMAMNMGYGARLSRHAIVREGGENFFVWIHHHTVADGWTLGLVLYGLQQAYAGLALPPLSSSAEFVRYSRNIDFAAAEQFWKSQLSGAQPAQWPPARTPTTAYTGVKRITERTINMPSNMDTSSTLATIMMGAWSLALGDMNKTEDVCFMTTSSGRQAPLKGIESVAGMTTARVPIRIQRDNSKTVSQFLSDIQSMVAETVAHEHLGIPKIAEIVPEVAPGLLNPSSLVVLQPARQRGNDTDAGSDDAILASALDKFSAEDRLDGFYLQPLQTDCYLGDGQITLSTNYHRELLDLSTVEEFHDKLERYILALSKNFDVPLGTAIRGNN
jgi:hypothetical protein